MRQACEWNRSQDPRHRPSMHVLDHPPLSLNHLQCRDHRIERCFRHQEVGVLLNHAGWFEGTSAGVWRIIVPGYGRIWATATARAQSPAITPISAAGTARWSESAGRANPLQPPGRVPDPGGVDPPIHHGTVPRKCSGLAPRRRDAGRHPGASRPCGPQAAPSRIGLAPWDTSLRESRIDSARDALRSRVRTERGPLSSRGG